MKIKDIYDKYSIPPNLREHMVCVAKVVQYLVDHWTGDTLDVNRLIKSALVHDLGNIVKFNFDKYPEFLGSEVKNIEYWKNKQKEIILKYGADDHLATQKMLNEIGFDDKSIEVISSKSFGNSVDVLISDNWYLKILLYADMRVLPTGLALLQDRLDDIMNRMPQYYNRPDINELLKSCKEIEKQIQENLSCDIHNINESNFTDDSILLNIEI